ncbi:MULTISPECIES: capsular polysaccharide export protein, LipB/KpsS family [unclassified Francisella]|uniref:capsular polysaccharide export protein, LipB/KpsS family n=1 Tax=unclassified Francisella TaxID=2610885 RepID=UPI002E30EFC0|nr:MULTISPECIES: glycosyltransferase [unclassified Francisella]MED7820124.1 glycosyltransferase [Francisella sp. 19S2-4]MED7830945.1 glycosyltransferase [Francisella sp. 19S2-10]
MKNKILNIVKSSYVKSRIFEDIIEYFKRYSEFDIIVTLKSIKNASVYYYFRPHLEERLKPNSIVTVHHDLNDPDPNLNIKKFIDRYIEAFLVICLNNSQKEELQLYGIYNTIVIPHGYDPYMLSKKTSYIYKPKTVIGFFSSYYPRLVKGEKFLFKLFALLPKDDFKFILVGKRRKKTAVNLRSLGFECIVFESLPYRFLTKLYSYIDFLLITSTHEGGPACLPEALYTNTPVISTRVGMVNDFKGEGIFFLTGNLSQDVSLLSRLSIDKKKVICDYMKKNANSLLSWENVIKWYDREFNGLIKSLDVPNTSSKIEYFIGKVNSIIFFYFVRLRALLTKPDIYYFRDIIFFYRKVYGNDGYSTSSKIIKKVESFICISKFRYIKLIAQRSVFYGWGRKKSGQKAITLAKRYKSSFVLLEDGFIRSIGLGIDNSPSFSLVEDDVGIYYDATTPSRLENILNSYDFLADKALMSKAREAISLIKKYNISKYNNIPNVDPKLCDKYGLLDSSDSRKNILIIAQTEGDSSLRYGLANKFTTNDMIESAILENPRAKIYLKIHPNVFSGKKKSDIDINNINSKVIIISENINSISLLKYFAKVYTKTSGMGFEALLVGCECICFGMPFYAGWGVTDDRITGDRRKRKLSVEEIFAASYILYTRYYNPYSKKESDIIDTIKTINKYKYIE